MADETHMSKLAILIDADNAQPSKSNLVLAEVAKYGTAFVKRAYGDWTGPQLNGWKDHLLENSIQPIQQFAYTTGKNITDAAMVIDAMDLLYSNRFGAFYLVSSDSDFTHLASRIRESGLLVYRCGERKTPKPFITACDKFIYIENLTPRNDIVKQINDSKRISEVESRHIDINHAIEFVREAVEANSDVAGWAELGSVGSLIVKRHPDFDSRTYGCAKLSGLITRTETFDITHRVPGEGKSPVAYVRERNQDGIVASISS